MKENNSERIKVGDLTSKYTVEQVADIRTQILKNLCEKADELTELFKEYKQAYPDIVAASDFSLICSISAAPFTVKDPPFYAMLGTQEGISKAARTIISALKEIA